MTAPLAWKAFRSTKTFSPTRAVAEASEETLGVKTPMLKQSPA